MLNKNILPFALMAATLAPAAQANILYSVTEIGNFSSDINPQLPPIYRPNSSIGNSINDQGQVAGSYSVPSWHYANLAYVTKPGDVKSQTDYAGLRVFSSSFGNAVNNSGQLAGSYATEDFSTHAFVTEQGSRVDLGTLGGTYSSAYGINDQGQVVGESNTSSFIQHAFLSTNGVMTDLGSLAGADNYSIGYAINNNGEVAGSSATSDNFRHAFFYANGSMTDLGTLGGDNSNAYAINNAGEVVGSSNTAGNLNSHAFMTVKGVMADLGSLGGGDSIAHGINDLGQVVGGDNVTGHAFIYSNGVMTDLNAYIASNSGWTLTSAMDINNLGQITGVGTNAKGIIRAFILTPVPLPAAVWLFGSVIFGYGVFARRKAKDLVTGLKGGHKAPNPVTNAEFTQT